MCANLNRFRIAVRKFGPFESAMAKLWKSYCDFSGCKLEVDMVPMDLHPLYESTIAMEGLKNGEWDIAHIVTDWIYEAYTSGSVMALQDKIAQNPPANYPVGWSNSLLRMQQFGEDIVGLPFHDGPECFIYRKDLFENPEEQAAFREKYGRELKVPSTWDEFGEVATFFNRPEKNLYGTIFACLPDGHNTVFDFCLQLWSRGGSLVDDNGKVKVDTREAIEGLTFYRQLVKDPSMVHPKSSEYESVQAGLAFARGEVAMMINWFGFASMCEVWEQSAVKGKVDITSIPHTDNNESASLNVYWLYAIGSGSKYQDVAYDFLRFAIKQENDKLLTLEGGIGCRISTWKDKEVNDIIPYYHKLELLHKNAKTLPQKSNWAQIADIIDKAVLTAMNTGKSAEAILQEAQKNIQILNTDPNAYTI